MAWSNRNVSLGAIHVSHMPCHEGAGGVIPGAMNSKRAGLAVSLGGAGWEPDIKVHVCHRGFVSRYTSVISYDRIILFCFMAPSFFLLGVFR